MSTATPAPSPLKPVAYGRWWLTEARRSWREGWAAYAVGKTHHEAARTARLRVTTWYEHELACLNPKRS